MVIFTNNIIVYYFILHINRDIIYNHISKLKMN